MAAGAPGSFVPPRSILIVGSGVFGLSTLHALLTAPLYAATHITIVDAHLPPPQATCSGRALESASSFATASLDSSRIVRADYADAAYSALASAAHAQWRAGFPSPPPAPGPRPDEPVYHEPGLLYTAHANGSGNPRAAAYVASSLDNVRRLCAQREQATGCPEPRVTPLSGLAAVAGALHPDDPAEAARVRADAAGDVGYFNAGAGRADASAAVARLRGVCFGLGAARGDASVRWVRARAERLLFEARPEGWVAAGAQVGGEEVRAEVTVVAAGAWTPALLPRSLGARLRAQAQPLAYLPLSAAECAGLAGRAIALNISSGIFAIAPPRGAEGEGHELKLAQHCFGFFHDVAADDTEPGGGGEVRVSVPAPEAAGIPASARKDLEAYLAGAFPSLVGREWRTKLCWYADSPTGDYLVDFAPGYGRSVLVASGGSGHAFKMLPLIGRWVLSRLEGRMEAEELGAELARKWRWQTDEEVREAWQTPGDGSRGGEMGLAWAEEMGLAAR